MKTFSFYVLLAFLLLSVQATVFSGVKPDFILVLVCFYSLRHGQMKGMIYGAFTGFLIDSASGVILGPNMFSKFLIGFMISSIRQKLFQWNIIVSALIIAIFSLMDIVLVYLFLETFAGISFTEMPFRILILQTVYTVIASLILYGFIDFEKDSGMPLRSF
ncbi:MAG: rod shape-determining protein MreD [Nitrospirota bacterium]